MTPSEQAAFASAVAAAISASAAVLSVVVAAVTVYLQIRWRRPSVTVKVTTAMPVITLVPGTLAGSRLGDPMLGIEIVNRGHVVVNVKSAGLTLRGDSTIPHTGFDAAPGTPTLPVRLEPGDETTLYFKGIREVAQTIAHAGEPALHAYGRLGGGREFKSKRIKPGWLEGWAKPR